MPRLTDANYINQRKKLRSDWYDRNGHAFGYLSGPEQRDLHLYFAVTKDLRENDRLRHRAEISKADPSLPQRAGRAYAAIAPHLDDDWPKQVAPISRANRKVVVRGIARPELDVEKLSKALLAMIREDIEKKKP